jgi:hypothetical protein
MTPLRRSIRCRRAGRRRGSELSGCRRSRANAGATFRPTWDQCYDFKNIFAKNVGEKDDGFSPKYWFVQNYCSFETLSFKKTAWVETFVTELKFFTQVETIVLNFKSNFVSETSAVKSTARM